jgi:hypothetical protein
LESKSGRPKKGLNTLSGKRKVDWHIQDASSTSGRNQRGFSLFLPAIMVFASSGTSYALNGISKARQTGMLTYVDNKYAKRQSQIENHRMRLETHRYRIQMERKKKYLVFLLAVVAAGLFSVWSLVSGWMSSSYYYAENTEDKRSLQDLAESIRRVRLRRQESLKDIEPGEGVKEQDDRGWGVGQRIRLPDQEHGEDSKNIGIDDIHLGIPPDKFLIDTLEEEKNSFDEENRLERLEEKIRISQEIRVKEELRAKHLEDKMAESLDALKQYSENLPPLRPPDIGEESFS